MSSALFGDTLLLYHSSSSVQCDYNIGLVALQAVQPVLPWTHKYAGSGLATHNHLFACPACSAWVALSFITQAVDELSAC